MYTMYINGQFIRHIYLEGVQFETCLVSIVLYLFVIVSFDHRIAVHWIFLVGGLFSVPSFTLGLPCNTTSLIPVQHSVSVTDMLHNCLILVRVMAYSESILGAMDARLKNSS